MAASVRRAVRGFRPEASYSVPVNIARQCSRNGCSAPAVGTVTFDYAGAVVVVGPLATFAEPHTYDMCRTHAEGLTAPRGWELVRLTRDFPEPVPTADDLAALADAVREAGRMPHTPPPARLRSVVSAPAPAPAASTGGVRVPHLRVLRDS